MKKLLFILAVLAAWPAHAQAKVAVHWPPPENPAAPGSSIDGDPYQYLVDCKTYDTAHPRNPSVMNGQCWFAPASGRSFMLKSETGFMVFLGEQPDGGMKMVAGDSEATLMPLGIFQQNHACFESGTWRVCAWRLGDKHWVFENGKPINLSSEGP